MTLHLHGLGHFHPPNEITNRFLEDLDIGTSDEWILERVGIRARRTVLPLDYIRETRNRDPRAANEAALHSNAELAAGAARLALARAGLARERVGLVISGSSAPDAATPAEAARVARELGLEVPAFDLNSACTSFWAQLHLVSGLRPERLPDFALLVVVDTLTRVVDYSDRSSAVLFGDGAAAAVVSLREPGAVRVEATSLDSKPSAAGKVTIPTCGFFAQEGRAVQMFAIRKTAEGLERLRAAAGDDAERPLHLVGHQANLRALETARERSGMTPERHHTNVEYHGNTGAPGAPSVVSQRWEKWGAEDDVALVGVGAGLSWGGALLRFEGSR